MTSDLKDGPLRTCWLFADNVGEVIQLRELSPGDVFALSGVPGYWKCVVAPALIDGVWSVMARDEDEYGGH